MLYVSTARESSSLRMTFAPTVTGEPVMSICYQQSSCYLQIQVATEIVGLGHFCLALALSNKVSTISSSTRDVGRFSKRLLSASSGLLVLNPHQIVVARSEVLLLQFPRLRSGLPWLSRALGFPEFTQFARANCLARVHKTLHRAAEPAASGNGGRPCGATLPEDVRAILRGSAHDG